jgi:hypothetical protein
MMSPSRNNVVCCVCRVVVLVNIDEVEPPEFDAMELGKDD